MHRHCSHILVSLTPFIVQDTVKLRKYAKKPPIRHAYQWTHTHFCQCALTHMPSGQTQWCSDYNHREDTGHISLDPTNQGLNRSQSSQSSVSSYYGLEAGRVSLGSKSISISLCCCFFTSPSLPSSLFVRWGRWWMAPFLSQHICNFPLLILALLVFVFTEGK